MLYFIFSVKLCSITCSKGHPLHTFCLLCMEIYKLHAYLPGLKAVHLKTQFGYKLNMNQQCKVATKKTKRILVHWGKSSIYDVNGPTILFWTSYPNFQYYAQFGDPHFKEGINYKIFRGQYLIMRFRTRDIHPG